MGTFIEVHTELKIRGKWLHWEQPHIDRDHELFGRMGYGNWPEAPPIAPMRGFPEDASETTAWSFKLFSEDNHSPSWLSAAESDEVTEWYNVNRPKKGLIFQERSFGVNSVRHLDEEPELVDAGLEDARVVFWFRN